MNQNQPHMVAVHKAEGGQTLSSMYVQADGDGPYLLITAPWESPEAHGQWIQSPENQRVFAQLSTFIEPGTHSVLLFHMEAAGRLHSQLRGEYLLREQFHVYRLILTEPGKREELGRKFREAEEAVHAKNRDQILWGGWRVEGPGDQADELVVFRCKDVPEEQMNGLLGMAAQTKEYNFKYVTL
jgi:quinol monooxygenase YgiN